MAYIDVDKFAEKICNFQAIDEDAANKMIWLLRTFPTADVAPKSEVDKWYYNYHVIKEELKQEKAYHKETEKLADRYLLALHTAKNTIAQEIFEEIEKILIDSTHIPDCARFVDVDKLAELKKKYTEGKE